MSGAGKKRKASGLFAVECKLPAHAVFMLPVLFRPADLRAHITYRWSHESLPHRVPSGRSPRTHNRGTVKSLSVLG